MSLPNFWRVCWVSRWCYRFLHFREDGVGVRLYADDTQLFQEFSLSDNTSPEIAIRKMERCVISIRQWMKTNMLKLNDDKTEILIIRQKSVDSTGVWRL